MQKDRNKNTFAFLLHPPEPKDVAKKYPFARFVPLRLLSVILRFLPPLVGSRITGFRLLSGEEIKGWAVICPLTAQQMLQDEILARKKVLEAVHLAEKLGCNYIGLGAFTSIVTDGGLYLSDKVKISLTTGNAYAAALIIENILRASERIGVPLKDSVIAIVGAAGSVGSACSKILASMGKKIILIDTRNDELRTLVQEVGNDKSVIESYFELPQPIQADFIVTVTNSAQGIITSRHVRAGTIIVDGAQPYNVSDEVIKGRNDVLVINSGVAFLKGIRLNMDVGLPEEEIYACLGEVLISSSQDWEGHYNLGKVEVSRVEEVLRLAPRLGLRVRDFRNSKGLIREEDFQRIKQARGKQEDGLSDL